MKSQEKFGVAGSIIITIVFAFMALYSYQFDQSSASPALIPVVGVIIGIGMTIIAVKNDSNKIARKKQQEKFSNSITHDSSFGNGDLKLYFDSSAKKVTICATTTTGSQEKVINNFIHYKSVETDNHIVSYDSFNNKILRTKNAKGRVDLEEYCINEELKAINVDIKHVNPNIKAYNDYAFITDDINEFIVIVTPSEIHVHRYSDIVSISYDENGTNVFNKSLGGAVAGGLLFGSVGAIVGSNTAKTTQNKEVRNMTIKILLRSTSNSTIYLKIYECGKDGSVLETKYAKAHYDALMEEVVGIKDIFSIIIDIVDKNIAKQKAAPSIHPIQATNIADELIKLAKLKDDGILSEEEFNAQKAKLLNL